MGCVRKQIVLVGLGPYARTVYYPLLERYEQAGLCAIQMVVDRQSEHSTVQSYLASRTAKPAAVALLTDDQCDQRSIDAVLDHAIAESGAEPWGCIIATEPRAHMRYARWAIERKLHILLEKPISAYDFSSARPQDALRLFDDYLTIKRQATAANVNIVVQTHRRAHIAYTKLKSYLQDFILQYHVPLTYIDIYHADGTWNMPWEYQSRENHPYKYGYGKLLHSGYHFIDLFWWLAELNTLIDPVPTHMRITAKQVPAPDAAAQLGDAVYEHLFGKEAWSRYASKQRPWQQAPQVWGETDAVILAQLVHEPGSSLERNTGQYGHVVTTGVLSLLQSSFSRRAWLNLPADTYKGNGRVRHERVTIQAGPLLNIQVHSYQSGDSTGDQFQISMYRNSALVGGESLDQRSIDVPSDSSDSLNHQAREAIFLDFLSGDTSRSGIEHHETPMRFLTASMYSVMTAAHGLPADAEISLDPATGHWFRYSRQGDL